MVKDVKEKKEKKSEINVCIDEVSTIKQKYLEIQKSNKLPSFDELNEEFDISKVDCDSPTLAREIRKAMIVKFSSVMQFVELLLNPSTGSTFNMYLVRGVNGTEKEILNELFEILGELEIDSIALDIKYNEKNEIVFIKEKFQIWKDMQPKLMKIADSLKLNWKKVQLKKQKSYFG